jgi:hypothetical protein
MHCPAEKIYCENCRMSLGGEVCETGGPAGKQWIGVQSWERCPWPSKIQRKAEDSEPDRCGATQEGWICVLPKGHEGLHRSGNPFNETWGGDTSEPMTYDDMVSLLPERIWLKKHFGIIESGTIFQVLSIANNQDKPQCTVLLGRGIHTLDAEELKAFYKFTTDGRCWYPCNKKGIGRHNHVRAFFVMDTMKSQWGQNDITSII